MADSRYREQLWTPGQPMDPTDPVMKPAELSQRLLHLERKLENLDVADLPVTDLQRRLEQSWRPDPTVLFDKGLITQDLLAGGSSADWKPLDPAYTNGFSAHPSAHYPRYRLLPDGDVQLGGIAYHAAGAVNLAFGAFTIPAGIRPANNGPTAPTDPREAYYPCVYHGGSGASYGLHWWIVHPYDHATLPGYVTSSSGSFNAGGWFSLETIRYKRQPV